MFSYIFTVSSPLTRLDYCQAQTDVAFIFTFSFPRCGDAYSDTLLGYANSIRTVDGGTHIDGLKASLTRILNNLGKKSKVIKVCFGYFDGSFVFHVYTLSSLAIVSCGLL